MEKSEEKKNNEKNKTKQVEKENQLRQFKKVENEMWFITFGGTL